MPVSFTYRPSSSPQKRRDSGAAFFFNAIEAERTLSLVEHAGFDRVVVDDAAGLLTNFDLAAQAIVGTGGAEVALTHWAGVVEPLVAARQIAHLDQMSGGRLCLRMRACSDRELNANDGAASHVATLQRTDEYLTVLRRLWANESPIDHEGSYYSLRDGVVPRKGPRGADIPIRIGGLSGSALKLAGRYADVFELTGGNTMHVSRTMGRVRAAALESGRSDRITFALPVRIEFLADRNNPASDPYALSIEGTPDRVALSLVSYAALGIGEFIICDLASHASIEVFGEMIAPLVRNSVARLEGVTSFASPAVASESGLDLLSN